MTGQSFVMEFLELQQQIDGVSVNEALLHVGQHDLPFGGVGASGTGHHHAREGFNTFSKLRPVFYQGRLSPIQMLFQPPYPGRPMRLLQTMIKWKTLCVTVADRADDVRR